MQVLVWIIAGKHKADSAGVFNKCVSTMMAHPRMNTLTMITRRRPDFFLYIADYFLSAISLVCFAKYKNTASSRFCSPTNSSGDNPPPFRPFVYSA